MSVTFINQNVHVDGDLTTKHQFKIKGKFKGCIKADSILISEGAIVDGNIHTNFLTCFGKIIGNVTVSEELEVKSSAEVIGTIKAGAISVQKGGIIKGKCTIENLNPTHFN